MKNLTILQINDLHGYLAPHSEIFDLVRDERVQSGGGLGRIATLFRNIRRDGDHPLSRSTTVTPFTGRWRPSEHGERP